MKLRLDFQKEDIFPKSMNCYMANKDLIQFPEMVTDEDKMDNKCGWM